MSLTPARTDLPTVGDTIAVVHSSGQWYVGRPLTVVFVDPNPLRPLAPRVVLQSWEFVFKLHNPEDQKRPDEMFETRWPFSADYPLEWNLLEALTPEERKPIDEYAERVANCTNIRGGSFGTA